MNILFVMLEILAILTICNILMGASDAIINDWKVFDWKTFLKGLLNYIVAFFVMFGVYYAGVIAEGVPDLNTVPIKVTIGILIGAAISKVGFEVIKKLGVFWGVYDMIKDKLGFAINTEIQTDVEDEDNSDDGAKEGV